MDRRRLLALGVGDGVAIIATGAGYRDGDHALDIVSQLRTVVGETRFGHPVHQQ